MNKLTVIFLISSLIAFSTILVSEQAFALKSQGNPTSKTLSKNICGDTICNEPMTSKEKVGYYMLSLLEFDESTVIPQSRFQISGVTQQGLDIKTAGKVMLKDFSRNSILEKGIANSLVVPIKENHQKIVSEIKIDSSKLGTKIKTGGLENDRFATIIDSTAIVFQDSSINLKIKDNINSKIVLANLPCNPNNMWSGSKCITLKDIQKNCDVLSTNTKLLCYQLIEMRSNNIVMFAEKHNLDKTQQKKIAENIFSDTSNLIQSMPNYIPNTKILCKINDFGMSTCASIISLLSFYDKVTSISIINDINTLYESSELNKNDNTLVDCGSGKWTTTNIDKSKLESSNSETESADVLMSEEENKKVSENCNQKKTNSDDSSNTTSGFSGITGIDRNGGMCNSEFQLYTSADMANNFVNMVESYRAQCDPWIGSGIAAGDSEDPPLEPLDDDSSDDDSSDDDSSDDDSSDDDSSDDDSSSGDSEDLPLEPLDGDPKDEVNTETKDGVVITTTRDGTRIVTSIERGHTVISEPNGQVTILRPSGKPMSCIDGDCGACKSNGQLLALTASSCINGGKGNTPFCQNMFNKNNCCSNSMAFAADPTILIPDQNGDLTCYGETNFERKNQFCTKQCGMMYSDTCQSSCMASHNVLFEGFESILNNYCRYAQPNIDQECKPLFGKNDSTYSFSILSLIPNYINPIFPISEFGNDMSVKSPPQISQPQVKSPPQISQPQVKSPPQISQPQVKSPPQISAPFTGLK